MKLVLYIVIALVGFCGMVVGTLYFKGTLNKEALTGLRDSLAGESEETEGQQMAAPEGQPLQSLAAALKEKEEQLAQREDEIAQEKKMLEQERAEFEKIRKELESLLKQMQQQVDSLDDVQEKELADLAKTYSGMRPENAAKILETLPLDNAVKILKRVPTRDRARIVEKMENASQVSEAIISELGD